MQLSPNSSYFRRIKGSTGGTRYQKNKKTGDTGLPPAPIGTMADRYSITSWTQCLLQAMISTVLWFIPWALQIILAGPKLTSALLGMKTETSKSAGHRPVASSLGASIDPLTDIGTVGFYADSKPTAFSLEVSINPLIDIGTVGLLAGKPTTSSSGAPISLTAGTGTTGSVLSSTMLDLYISSDMLDLMSYLIPRAGKATELLVAAGRLSSTTLDLSSYLTHRVTSPGEAAPSVWPSISLQDIPLIQNYVLTAIMGIDN